MPEPDSKCLEVTGPANVPVFDIVKVDHVKVRGSPVKSVLVGVADPAGIVKWEKYCPMVHDVGDFQKFIAPQ